MDLVETSHEFERDGAYTITLAVRDEDGLVATETRRVLIGNAVEVKIEGDLETVLQTGNGPTSVCPVPLGEGGCGLNLQYWDDKNRSYLFLQLYGNPLLEPREYPIVQANERHLVEGVQVPEATGIVSGGWSQEDYEIYQGMMQVTECRNAGLALPSFSPKQLLKKGGLKGLGKGVLGPLGGLLGGKQHSGADPTGAGYAATSGRLEMLRADEERVGGKFSATMGAERNGRPVSVNVEGVFSAVFDEFADKFLALCEPGPFKISGRFPGDDSERVDFARPDVWVSVTRPLAPESISTDAIWLETRNAGGHYDRVPVRLLHDSERHRVHLLPITGLDPARRYRIQVAGGEAGLRSRTGEKLQGEESWQFATMPDLYRKAEGGGGSLASFATPASRVVPAVLRGRPGMTPVEYARRSAAPPRFVPAGGIQIGKGSTIPNVTCDAFQVSRNQPLVVGKSTAFRVYLDWSLPDSADDAMVTDVEADVRIVDGNDNDLPGLARVHQPDKFEHRDFWQSNDAVKRSAAQTANFAGWLADPLVTDVYAQATIVDAKGKKHVFEGLCPVSHWPVDDPSFRVGVFTLPVGGWEERSPDLAELKEFLDNTVLFLEQNFPVSKAEYEAYNALEESSSVAPKLPRVVLPNSTDDAAPIVLNRSLFFMQRLRDAVRDAGLSFDLVVGLYPSDTTDTLPGSPSQWEWEGYNYSRPNGGSGEYSSSFPEPTVRMKKNVSNYDAGGVMTLAHEGGHSYGLKHTPGPASTEALRIYPDPKIANKSSTDGNSEGQQLLPLMVIGDRKVEDVFITDANYVLLMKELRKYFHIRNNQ